ncbi:MAG: SCO family protein [Bacteroidota bacterium]
MIKNALLANIVFFLLAGCKEPEPKLQYLGQYDVIYSRQRNDTVFHKIPSFSFLNQDSVRVSNQTYAHKMWLVEFFFTSCPTICPIMNKQLLRLHQEISPSLKKELQFLSFSIDPANDPPSKLKSYSDYHKIPKVNWDLLTGNEVETHRLGIDHFMVFAGKDSLSAGGYAHSGAFTLVDAQGYVRGVYAVTNMDLSVNEQEYARMVKELNILYNEHLISRKKTAL